MKKEKGSDRISTFIGADASIDGSIEFKGTIRVDGTVKGKISSNSGVTWDEFLIVPGWGSWWMSFLSGIVLLLV